MIGQQFKTVVSIGGAVDSSFQKIGSTFEQTMGQATRSVKDLEREQDKLTRSIKRSEKAAAALADMEAENAASVAASKEMVAQREAMTRTINTQARALRRLDDARENTTDVAELSRLNAQREEVVRTLESERGARDKITAEIKSAHRAQKQFDQESKKIKDNIEDADQLATKMDEVAESLKGAKKEAGGLEKAGKLGSTFRKIGIGAAAATAAVWGMAGALGGAMTFTNEHTSEMVGLAKSYDMSIERFKAWSGVAAQAGFDGEHVGDLIEELSNKFGEFKVLGEQSTVSDVFGALGLDQAMLDGMSAADQFEFIMARIEKVQDKQQAASLADQLFGGEGNKIAMYIRNSGKAMSELLEEQRRFNLLTDEGAAGATAYGQSFKNLKSVVTSGWQEISGILGGEMAGEIQSLGDTVAGFVRENKTEIVEGIKGIIDAAKDLAVGLWRVGGVVNSVVQAFGGWQTVGVVVASIFAGKMVLGIGRFVSTGYGMIKMLGASRLAMSALGFVMNRLPFTGVVPKVYGLAKSFGVATWGAVKLGASLVAVGVKSADFGFVSLVSGGYALAKSFAAASLGAIKFGLALLANPIGATVAAVGLLVTAGVLLYQNWDKVTAWFSEKFEWFKTEFPATFGVLKTVFDWSPMGMVINNWGPISDFFGGLFDGIVDLVKSRIEMIVGAVTKVTGWIGKLKFWGDEEEVPQPVERTVIPIGEGRKKESGGWFDGWFGSDEAPAKPVKQPAAMQQDRSVAALARADMGSRGTTVHQSVGDIQIHAAPGQSPQDIARAVHEKLSGSRSSALYDLPEVG